MGRIGEREERKNSPEMKLYPPGLLCRQRFCVTARTGAGQGGYGRPKVATCHSNSALRIG
jgi:hypothetical protein